MDKIKTYRSFGSSFKCNTQSPLGIGCCDGHTKQAPQQRGTWRDISRAHHQLINCGEKSK
jgi:hypothetical protein